MRLQGHVHIYRVKSVSSRPKGTSKEGQETILQEVTVSSRYCIHFFFFNTIYAINYSFSVALLVVVYFKRTGFVK